MLICPMLLWANIWSVLDVNSNSQSIFLDIATVGNLLILPGCSAKLCFDVCKEHLFCNNSLVLLPLISSCWSGL